MSFPGETKGLWTQVPTMEDNENSGGVLMGLWRAKPDFCFLGGRPSLMLLLGRVGKYKEREVWKEK